MRPPIFRGVVHTLLALSFLLGGSSGARAIPSNNVAFRFERDLVPARRGGNRLPIDVAVLAGVAHGPGPRFSDLRLFTRGGLEVPYLLIAPPRPVEERAAVRILPIQASKTSSGFEADLGALLLVDRLRLPGLPAPFLKRMRLEGSGDRVRWIVLEGEVTLFDLPAEKLERTAIEFAAEELRYFRVSWDDASSARVPLARTVLARLVRGGVQAPLLRASLPLERRAAEPGKSRYRVSLPAARSPVAALEFVPAVGGNIMRTVSVSEARLAGNGVLPVTLGSATLRRSERAGVVASDLRVSIAPPQEVELEVAIDDGDNPPLDLVEIAAVFAPQPWVYFESADGEPLVARFGASGLVAPRYDLEAARGIASTDTTLPQAGWGEQRVRPEVAAPELAGEVLAGGAALDVGEFRVVRILRPGPPGLTTLRLDLAVLVESPSLCDVRLATQDGRQVPYLLETLAEPLTVDLSPPRRLPETRPCGLEHGRRGTWSCYVLEMPAPSLPSALFAVTTSVRVFQRQTLLRQERRYPRNEVALDLTHRGDEFLTAYDGVWSHADPESPAQPLTVSLPSLPRRELYLAIDDGDNGPLPLVRASLYLPAYRLRFFRPSGSELRLLYGRRGLEAPRYDIALLGPRLLGASAHEATLPAAGVAPGPRLEPGQTRFFWIVLVGAVAVLLLLVVRLLRKRGDGEAASP